jgi:predicted GIY-YIG superfamily endonuclease
MIVSNARSYIGATVSPTNRLRKHNGELCGGAEYTRGATWEYRCVISGFRSWREALQFEWAWKHDARKCRSIAAKMEVLDELMGKNRWSSNAPLAAEVPVRVEHFPPQ